MMIEIIEQNAKGGESPFRLAADWFDSQISKGVLGQTATTQGTPGKLGSDDAQKEVRQDIKDSDAEQLEETLNRDLVIPFVILNFGPQKEYPRLTLKEPESEDLKVLVESLEKLVPLGLKVEQSVVRDKLGLPDPADGAELLAVQRPEPVAQEENGLEIKQPEEKEPSPGQKAVNAEMSGPVSRSGQGSGFTPEQQALENMADSVIRQAAEAMKANEDKLLAVIMESSSYEEMILERAMLKAGLF
jgi:phage gp29-like protein